MRVQDRSWPDVSSGDMYINDVKLSPVVPHKRSGDTFQNCSAISYVDTYNYQLFYDDFSCDNNNQCQSYSNHYIRYCHMGSSAHSGRSDTNYDDMSYNWSGNSLSLNINDVLLDQKSCRPLPKAIAIMQAEMIIIIKTWKKSSKLQIIALELCYQSLLIKNKSPLTI